MTAVLFVAEGGSSALPYYRARIPAQGLRQRGWTAWETITMAQSRDMRLRAFDTVTGKNGPAPSVVVCRHLRDPDGHELDSVKMFGEARSKGQRVFYDLDDDYWQLPGWNPAAPVWDAEALRILDANLGAASGVLCSTEALARAAREHTDTPVFVAHNGVSLAGYHPRDADHEPLRLGWLGLSAYRARDLETIAPALRLVCAEFAGKVELWHLGDHHDHAPIEDVLGHDFPVPIRKRRWVPAAELPARIVELDVAVMPMELGLPLNAARSATTGLALAAGGVPYVASPNGDYGELALRGVGFLARYLEQWVMYLRHLLGPDADRVGLGRAWRDEVARLRSPAKIAGDYVHAFEAVDS